jgi:carboxypeptidase PM20D1
LGFGHDEEIDGEFGAQEISRVLIDRGIELEFLLDEGLPVVEQLFTGLSTPVAFVAVAEKGYLSLELTCEANGGHSSVPQGLTAIAQLSNAIYKLEQNPMPAKVDKLVKSSLVGIPAHDGRQYAVNKSEVQQPFPLKTASQFGVRELFSPREICGH